VVSPCQRSLFKVSVQDVYKRSPRKIPARDPQARSLFSSQILCTKRSLGKHSLQTLHKTFPGKISARGLTTNKKKQYLFSIVLLCTAGLNMVPRAYTTHNMYLVSANVGPDRTVLGAMDVVTVLVWDVLIVV
jgi:hypothetical protein